MGVDGAMAGLGEEITLPRAIARLRAMTQADLQSHWHVGPVGLDPDPQTIATLGPTWPQAQLNQRQHIPWPQGRQVLWLWQRLTVPPTLAEYPLGGHDLDLGLTWWADWAEVYVNGQRVQTGDLFECFTRIPLGQGVSPGQGWDLALRLVSPDHDAGALVRSQVDYSFAPLEPERGVEPGFVAAELGVLQHYLAVLAPGELGEIAAIAVDFPWDSQGDGVALRQALQTLRHRLAPWGTWLKEREIRCLGHAHLDLAWLWPIEDTWDAAQRTFTSVLALKDQFPELTYTHSSPALFQWLEQHRPALFAQVQGAIAAGWWHLDGGLWVEPELNTLSGESLARQILLGQRYCRDRFGRVSALAWLPDSFGFSWQLPQLLHQGGIRYFATQKLGWNDTTPFPHHLFWWRGRDGTALASVTLPPIGSDLDPLAMAKQGATWEAATGLKTALWLPGLGDHGGGPTAAMLHQARRWSQSPLFPRLTFGSAETWLDQAMAAWSSPVPRVQFPHAPSSVTLTSPGSNSPAPDSLPTNSPGLNSPGLNSPDNSPPDQPHPALPIWDDELYLELHRGCYTTHGDQKWYNRHCERRLYEAELWATLAAWQLPDYPYPQEALGEAWRGVLFNQFHDILPGTAIAPVFTTANATWQTSLDLAQGVIQGAIAPLAAALPRPAAPAAGAIALTVFNPLSWPRSGLVSLPHPGGSWQILTAEGTPLPCQVSTEDRVPPPGCLEPPQRDRPVLLFPAEAVPGVGYRCYWLVPAPEPAPLVDPGDGDDWVLANDHLQARIDPSTGNLISLQPQDQPWEALGGAANGLQGFEDKGQYWDAWNLAPDYQAHPLPSAALDRLEWCDRGPLRQRLRVVRRLGQSQFQQDYVLDWGSEVLRVETVVDWRETQVVAKVAFPLAVTSDEVTYGIPFGAIARPIQSDDPHQRAKWEVPALDWADLTGQVDGHAAGVAILTDYKHGFDAQANQLRLTLLKAPLWPDPQADRGSHGFSYGLLPHRGTWQTARIPHQAMAFNHPLQVHQTALGHGSPAETATGQGEWFSFGQGGLAIAALKQAEDGRGWIFRCWDPYGTGGTANLPTPAHSSAPGWQRTTLLEDTPSENPGNESTSYPWAATPEALAPWAIATYRLERWDIPSEPRGA